MPNTINLRLLENRNIISEHNGIMMDNANAYKIIAGEDNATEFKIISKPSQYQSATYTVKMVNSKGYEILETPIINDSFVLPSGMAVAGYGKVLISAKMGTEIVPFMPLKLKIWETINGWELGVDIPTGGGSSITVDSEMSDTSTNPVQNKVAKKYVDGLFAQAQEAVAHSFEQVWSVLEIEVSDTLLGG